MAPRRKAARVSYRPADAFKDIDFGSGSDRELKMEGSEDSLSEFEVARVEQEALETSSEGEDDVISSDDAPGQEPEVSDNDPVVQVVPKNIPTKSAGAPRAKISVIPAASATFKRSKQAKDSDEITFNRYHPRSRVAGEGFMRSVMDRMPEEPNKAPIAIRAFGPISEPHSISAKDREELQASWAGVVAGPARVLSEDVSWSKGKWKAVDKWGAWGAQASDAQHVSFEEAVPYFPRAVQPVDSENEADAKFDLNGDVVCEVCGGKKGPPAKLRMERFSALPLASALPKKPGYILNAGAPVWALDWCPQAGSPPSKEYLALGTLSSDPAIGEFARSSANENGQPVPSLLQIWSLDCSDTRQFSRTVPNDLPENAVKLEMGLCVDVGEAWQLKWCPRGGLKQDPEATTLGMLAGCFTDGRIHIFAVPKPAAEPEKGVQYYRLQPLLTLSLPETSLVSLDWSSHERIIGGAENGWVAVWDLPNLAANKPAVPTMYFPAHLSAVRRVAVLQVPPTDGNFAEQDDQEPHLVSFAGQDGSMCLVDLRDPSNVQVVVHERGINTAVAFSPLLGGLAYGDADHFTCFLSLRPRHFGSHTRLQLQSGFVHDVAASRFHPFFASAAADGTCAIDNAMRHLRQKQHAVNVVNTVYKLDYDRATGEYRMLDNLLPERVSSKDNASKVAKNALGASTIAAWRAEVGIHCVGWCPTLQRAPLLASGTASGLVRIDWTEGFQV